jgi:hypothetical protein
MEGIDHRGPAYTDSPAGLKNGVRSIERTCEIAIAGRLYYLINKTRRGNCSKKGVLGG